MLAYVAGFARLRRGGTVVLASPWPGDWSVTLSPLPFELGTDRLFARASAQALRTTAAPPPVVALAEVKTVEAAADWIRINERAFARCASRTQAVAVAQLVLDLVRAPAETRPALVRRYVLESTSRERLRAVLPTVRAAVRPLTVCCTALLLLIFVYLPIGAEIGFSPEQWLATAGALIVLFGVGVWLLARAHRALPPGSPSRSELVLPMALFPPALLRAPDVLLREAFAPFHPLLVASESLRRDELIQLMRRELARLAYPEWRGDADLDDPGRRAFMALQRDALLELAGALELPQAAVEAPSGPTTPEAARYCPSCLGEFRAGFTRCRECDVATVPFS